MVETGGDPAEAAGRASLASCRAAALADLEAAVGAVLGGGVGARGDGEAPFPDDVMALLAARAGRDEGLAHALWEVVDGDVAELHLMARLGVRGDDADADEAAALDAVARGRMVDAVALAVGGGPDDAVRYEDGSPLEGLGPDDATPVDELVGRVAVAGPCVVATLSGARHDLVDPTWLDVWRIVVADHATSLEADPEGPALFHHFYEGLHREGDAHLAVMGS